MPLPYIPWPLRTGLWRCHYTNAALGSYIEAIYRTKDAKFSLQENFARFGNSEAIAKKHSTPSRAKNPQARRQAARVNQRGQSQQQKAFPHKGQGATRLRHRQEYTQFRQYAQYRQGTLQGPGQEYKVPYITFALANLFMVTKRFLEHPSRCSASKNWSKGREKLKTQANKALKKCRDYLTYIEKRSLSRRFFHSTHCYQFQVIKGKGQVRTKSLTCFNVATATLQLSFACSFLCNLVSLEEFFASTWF